MGRRPEACHRDRKIAPSLLHAEGSKRFVRAPGLGVLNQRQPGCFATLGVRKFLGRYHGAIGNAEPAEDD
jgi:hypothetical protein